jgi:hypothetical protein
LPKILHARFLLALGEEREMGREEMIRIRINRGYHLHFSQKKEKRGALLLLLLLFFLKKQAERKIDDVIG